MTEEKVTEEAKHKVRYVTLEHLAIDIEKSIRDWLAIHGKSNLTSDDMTDKHSITALSRKVSKDLYHTIIERRQRDNDRRKRPRNGRRWDDPSS